MPDPVDYLEMRRGGVAVDEPGEEVLKHPRGGRLIDEFLPTEPVDLVSAQPQLPVLGHHRGIAPRTGRAVGVGVVLPAVALDDDPHAAGQQHQEVMRWRCSGAGPGRYRIRVYGS
jgi:hypothetical protein